MQHKYDAFKSFAIQQHIRTITLLLAVPCRLHLLLPVYLTKYVHVLVNEFDIFAFIARYAVSQCSI